METQSDKVQPVTMADILQLATWNRERSSEELQSFINTRHLALPDDSEIE
jgi:hypothetical protein